jgi:hypothetical protein
LPIAFVNCLLIVIDLLRFMVCILANICLLAIY